MNSTENAYGHWGLVLCSVRRLPPSSSWAWTASWLAS